MTWSCEAALRRARELGFLGPGELGRQIEHARGFVRALRDAVGGSSPTAARPSAGGRQLGAPPGADPLDERLLDAGPVDEGPVDEAPQGTLLDLGSGGGLPGLVLAEHLPGWAIVLLEANGRRAAFLEEAVRRCGWSERVRVDHRRAEVAGRDPDLRGSLDVVTARSFGPPAVAAECASPLLRSGGWLIASEPPSGDDGASSGRGVEAHSAGDVRPDAAGPAGGGRDPRWPVAGLHQLGMAPGQVVRDVFGYQVIRQVALCPDRFPRRNGVPAKRPLF